MANYGAIAIGEGVAREAQHTHVRRRLRIALALVLLVVGVVLLATVGVSRVNVPAVLALIPTSSPSTLSPASEEEENVSEGEASEPTADTFATMLNEELNVLVHLGISQASIPDTDLDEACGAFRTPCVASVGACLIHFSVVGPDGKVTVDQEQCNCYAKSSIDSISVYGNPFVGVHCDYTCLESINGVFNQYLAEKNGPSGARKNCDLTFSNMADKQFGSDHDVVAQPADLDSLTVMELDNPKVVRAGEVLQEYINEERTKHCPLMNKVSAAAVTYARVGMVDDARFAYHIGTTLSSSLAFLHRYYCVTTALLLRYYCFTTLEALTLSRPAETVLESEDQWTAFLREAGSKGPEAQTESGAGAEEFVATIQHLPQKDQLAGTQFTCFTSKKVQILTQKTLLAAQTPPTPTQFTCFTSTKVQVLTRKRGFRPLQRQHRPQQLPRPLCGCGH